MNSNLLYKILIISLFSFICYFNSLNGDFLLDDEYGIIKNPDLDIHSSLNITSLFQHDFWGFNMDDANSHKSYRPFTILIFRFINFISQKFPIKFQRNVFSSQSSPLYSFYFHLINVLSHTLVSILFYIFLHFFVFSPSSIYSLSSLCISPLFTPSLWGAILFAVHPIHVDAVSSCVGLSELLSGICFLCSFIFYLISYHQTHNFLVCILSLLGSIGFAFIGTLCKEQCITVLVVCAFYDIFILNRLHIKIFQWLKKTSSLSIMLKSIPSSLILLFMRVLLFFFAFLAIMSWRYSLHGLHLVPPFDDSENHLLSLTYSKRLLSTFYIFSYSFYLLFFPFSLCCDWSGKVGAFPAVNSLFDYRFIFSLMIFGFILILIYISWRLDLSSNKNEKEHNSLLYSSSIPYFSLPTVQASPLLTGLLIYFITYIPLSSLFFPVGFVLAERCLYLSSLGFCLILVSLIFSLPTILSKFKLQLNNNSTNFLIFSLNLLIIFIFSMKTIQRSGQWNTAYSLYSHDIQMNPHNPRLVLNYGMTLFQIQRYQESLPYLTIGAQTQDLNSKTGLRDRQNAYILLIKACQKLKKIRDGLKYIEEWEKKPDEDPEHILDIGVFYGESITNYPEHFQKAEYFFQKLESTRPYESCSNLALLYHHHHQSLKALEIIEKCILRFSTNHQYVIDFLQKCLHIALQIKNEPHIKKYLYQLLHMDPQNRLAKTVQSQYSISFS